MFNITSNFFRFFNNKSPAGKFARITRDFVACYYCLKYSSIDKLIFGFAEIGTLLILNCSKFFDISQNDSKYKN